MEPNLVLPEIRRFRKVASGMRLGRGVGTCEAILPRSGRGCASQCPLWHIAVPCEFRVGVMIPIFCSEIQIMPYNCTSLHLYPRKVLLSAGEVQIIAPFCTSVYYEHIDFTEVGIEPDLSVPTHSKSAHCR